MMLEHGIRTLCTLLYATEYNRLLISNTFNLEKIYNYVFFVHPLAIDLVSLAQAYNLIYLHFSHD